VPTLRPAFRRKKNAENPLDTPPRPVLRSPAENGLARMGARAEHLAAGCEGEAVRGGDSIAAAEKNARTLPDGRPAIRNKRETQMPCTGFSRKGEGHLTSWEYRKGLAPRLPVYR